MQTTKEKMEPKEISKIELPTGKPFVVKFVDKKIISYELLN